MSSSMLHPDLKRALAHRAGRPYRFVDPDTNATYVLMGAEYFDQLAPGQPDALLDETDGPIPGHPGEPSNGKRPPEPDFPSVGTPEWGEMNRRRAELIRKKLRGQLTEEEREQYEWLQRRSLEALDAACPLPAARPTRE
jgi:hypothetical protein